MREKIRNSFSSNSQSSFLCTYTQVRLRGRRGGVELPGSPLTPTFPGGTWVKAKVLDRRNVLDDSINFLLPELWTSGTLELEVQGVGVGLNCLEKAGPTPNDCKTTVTFQAAPTFQVKLVRIKYNVSKDFVSETSTDDLLELQNRLLSIFPVTRIDLTTGYLDMAMYLFETRRPTKLPTRWELTMPLQLP
jgi:hypothetical protein